MEPMCIDIKTYSLVHNNNTRVKKKQRIEIKGDKIILNDEYDISKRKLAWDIKYDFKKLIQNDFAGNKINFAYFVDLKDVPDYEKKINKLCSVIKNGICRMEADADRGRQTLIVGISSSEEKLDFYKWCAAYEFKKCAELNLLIR
ncbi:MAG: hypothetical protein MJ187_01410 [Alphaproteobacteria bacterium]|nr:hypothetical protein [Alphaproteobacteria bacterium]